MHGILQRHESVIRWFILILLLLEFIEITSGRTKLHKSIKWHRFKRQHHPNSLYTPQTNHSRHQYSTVDNDDQHHLVIPQNVALGQDDSQYRTQESGRWGPWSENSECSRTCGGGVATQFRTCLDVRSDGAVLCYGPNKKHFSCNIQDCPEGSKDFRAEQCARFNNVPFEGIYYDWLPYTQASNKCELNCMPKGESVYYRHARRVIDGTRCDPELLDVCVDGICLPVGCDLMLGSNAKEDKCRECGGDGSSCKTIKELYDLPQLQIGYNDILLIPAGATNIIIKERRPSNNFLAIRNTTGHYYLNGNFRIDFPRELHFAGTTIHYERLAQTSTAPESLRALGPTTESLFIVLLYQEPNVGIDYEYSIPLAVSQVAQLDTYSWVYGSYSNCSGSCAGGMQTRNVSCARSSTFETVPDYLCDPQMQPPNNRSCNTQPCPPSWNVEEWEECSVSCGAGVQFRVVYCHQNMSGSIPSIVDNYECENTTGPRPSNMRPCDTGVPCPQWNSGPWSSCDKLCGAGKQTRAVTCQRNATGILEVFPDNACKGEAKPASDQECDNGPCEGVDWILSEWSGCESCNLQAESRQALCSNQHGTIFPDEVCDTVRLPQLMRDCVDSMPCEVMWYASQWSECSAKCGVGVETRDVFCATAENDVITRVPDDKCDPDKRYGSRQNCTMTKCEGTWFTGPWNRCTAPCGAGHKTRKVLCLNSPDVSSNCDASKKPLHREPCNTHPCDEDEIMTVGGCKDSKHGCCPDGVTPSGPNYEGCPNVIPVDGCELTEFGCCSDGLTPALGPFRKGCPKVYNCKDAKFGCCPDGVTPAKGADHLGCPVPESCASTLYGCCPDGITAALGIKFAGCDFIPSDECLTSEFGCCPDGATSAEGSGYEGCFVEDEVKPEFKDLDQGEDIGSGLDCAEAKYGCCPDGITPAEGPDGKGCLDNTTDTWLDQLPFGDDCDNSTFGCCPDNFTIALGPDGEGCDNATAQVDDGDFIETSTLEPEFANVTISELDPELDNVTTYEPEFENATAEEFEPESSTVITDIMATEEPFCVNSAFGCCQDNITEATGPDYEGCPPAAGEVPTAECRTSSFGCCPDKHTAASGPNWEGCTPCSDMPFGCCYDRITPAKGQYFEGCGCETFPYGCCPDGVNFARGPDHQGCGCQASPYGCCPDGVTYATGPSHEGCGCERTEHGCCPDQITQAHGPNNEGCPCSTLEHGCCPDQRTAAQGPHYAGCSCETWYYGCCPDGHTAARGPDNAGCGCEFSHFGCCADGQTPAQGPNSEGCVPAKPAKSGVVCGLPKERGECRNYTVKWFFDMDYGGCSRFWYGGCDGNENRFDSQEECHQTCTLPEGKDVCPLPRVVGPCDGKEEAWHYDATSDKCNKFHYSGCLGNNNRFPTQEQCEKTCHKPMDTETDICMQPKMQGPCDDYKIYWYFDQEAQQCGRFYYGGCDGNNNRFDGEEDCQKACTAVPPPQLPRSSVCELGYDPGECSDRVQRWFYDIHAGQCRNFTYSGCGGNDNNFGSWDECQQLCLRDASGAQPTEATATPFYIEFCLLDKDAGPCTGSMEKYYYDKADGVCKQFQYGGCQGNGNRFSSPSECEKNCSSSQDICSLPKVHGPCSGAFRQWFYSGETNSCEEFSYGGCQGNANRFNSPEECESTCVAQPTVAPTEITDVCSMPNSPGSCMSTIPSWYYDTAQRKCLSFIFSGCEGNANRFESEEACERYCGDFRGINVCLESQDPGPCMNNIEKWYYDSSENACKTFNYGGCHGNANRFSSDRECKEICLINGQQNGPALPEPANVTDLCRLPEDRGPCNELHTRWFYDFSTSKCSSFTYGGCGGNANHFYSENECVAACMPRKYEVCPEPVECPQDCLFGPERIFDGNMNCTICHCLDPCATVNCEEGLQCLAHSTQGYPEGTCVPSVPEPQCHCPPLESYTNATCDQQCQHDDECHSGDKCCFNGCGYSCTEPTCAPDPAPPATSEPAAVGPPHIVSDEHEVVTSSGTIATLPCTAEGNPQPAIEWQGIDNQPVDVANETSRFRLLVDGSLQIDGVQATDTGNYVCIARNPGGEAEKAIRLVVQDPVPTPARIIGGIKVVVAPIDKPCMLNCNAQGWPRPSVTWWRESLMLPRTSERYEQYNNYSLKIRQMSMQDMGPYECRAYNGIGQVAVWEVTVFLDGPPVLDPTDAKLKYFGNEAGLEGNEPQRRAPIVNQQDNNNHTNHNEGTKPNDHNNHNERAEPNDHANHNQGAEPNDRTNHNREADTNNNDIPNAPPLSNSPPPLPTTSVSNGHDGLRTANGGGKWPPVPQEPPQVSNERENVSAQIITNKTLFAPDSEIQLDCVTTGSQRTLWYKDGSLLHTDERVLVFGNGTLLIKSSLPMDSGTYQCEAANYYNTATSTITIKVNGVNIPEACTDNLYFANCRLIVKAKYCTNQYYAKFCCRSCAVDGQLSPQASADIANNLV